MPPPLARAGREAHSLVTVIDAFTCVDYLHCTTVRVAVHWERILLCSQHPQHLREEKQ